MNIALVWFRNNLRIHDNACLQAAKESGNPIVGFYVFDTSIYKHPTNILQLQFILQALDDLKSSLQKLNIPLYIAIGDTAEELKQLPFSIDTIYYPNRIEAQEQAIEQKVLCARTCSFISYDENYLLSLEQRLALTTHSFHEFVAYMQQVKIAQPMPGISAQKKGSITIKLPSFKCNLRSFNIKAVAPNIGHQLLGGESEAFRRMYHFLHGERFVDYGNSKKDHFCFSHSSKLSPYLNLGCLSPRMFYFEIIYAQHRFGVDYAAKLLLRRLYAREYAFVSYESNQAQIQRKASTLKLEENIKAATTGLKPIDAALVEVRNSGYLSFSMRRVLLSYLISTYNYDTNQLLSFFQQHLIDYEEAQVLHNILAYEEDVDNTHYKAVLEAPVHESCLEGYSSYWLQNRP